MDILRNGSTKKTSKRFRIAERQSDRKMKKFFCLILTFVLLLGCFATICFAFDEGVYDINGYNGTARTSGVYLFDYYFGKTTLTKGEVLELVIEDGVITGIFEGNSEIPRYGYVVAIRGKDLISKFSLLKVGDVCIVDKLNSKVTIPNDDFSPFFEKSVKFKGYNSTRVADSIIIYNKGETTKTNVWGNEAVVDANGYVVSIGGNDNAIPEGGFVVSAVGAGRISELNEAAAIGLKATIDDGAKTVTFSYNEESIIASMEIKCKNALALLEKANEEFAIIDKDAADGYVKKLGELVSNAKTAISDGDTAKAIAISKAFDQYYDDKYLYLDEKPLVEGRAMWLRPLNLNTREAVREKVEEIKGLGYNIICLELFFDSTFICPMPEGSYIIQNPSFKGFDVLEAFIEECASFGVELQGWLPVYRVSYSTSTYYKDSLAYKKPEWLCKSKNGADYVRNEYGDGYFIDPSNKEAEDYLFSVYEYILKNYKLDGLQLDYIRYPVQTGEEFGYNKGTIDAFTQKYGTSPLNLSKTDNLWNDWVEFRASFVTAFVERISSLIKEVSPRTALACDFAPNLAESKESHLQDAVKWMQDEKIEMAFPMAYGTNVVKMYSSQTVDAFGGKGFSYIGFGDYGYEVLIKQILEVRQIGADGFAFFSYSQYNDGKYSKYIASSILASSAVSPTYNARIATIEQLKTIKIRLSLIGGYDKAISSIDEFIGKLENEKLSAYSDEILGFIDSFTMPSAEKAKNAISSDLSFLKRIVKLSHDEFRDFSIEVGEESIGDISNETSETGDIDDDNNFVTWTIIGCVALVALGIVFIIIKKKK